MQTNNTFTTSYYMLHTLSNDIVVIGRSLRGRRRLDFRTHCHCLIDYNRLLPIVDRRHHCHDRVAAQVKRDVYLHERA